MLQRAALSAGTGVDVLGGGVGLTQRLDPMSSSSGKAESGTSWQRGSTPESCKLKSVRSTATIAYLTKD